MLLFPESGPKKNFRDNGFTKTVTPHLPSIVPNLQRRMAYVAPATRPAGPPGIWSRLGSRTTGHHPGCVC